MKSIISNYQEMSYVFSRLETTYPLYKKNSRYIYDNFNNDYLKFSEALILVRFQKDRKRIDQSIKAFIKYSNEYLILQSKLIKEGSYSTKSYKDASLNVYQNSDTMNYYLDGLFLSQILWPNHYLMLQFFDNHLQTLLPGQHMLDLPCGTGVQSLMVLRSKCCASLDCMDISQSSVDYTSSLLGSEANKINFKKYDVHLKNVFDLNCEKKYDFICCGELLEHLEDPQALLDVLCKNLKKNGQIYLTTAIFAAAIDHIYLFRSVSDVHDMLQSKFTILKEIVLPISKSKYDQKMIDEPINYACILEKKCLDDLCSAELMS